MERDRFSHLSSDDKFMLFEALLFCFQSSSGIGFPRYDQLHPDYFDGMNGRTPPFGADSADTNKMFQMLRELSLHIADEPARLIYKRFGVTTWEQFCSEAIKAGKSGENHQKYTPLYLRPTQEA